MSLNLLVSVSIFEPFPGMRVFYKLHDTPFLSSYSQDRLRICHGLLGLFQTLERALGLKMCAAFGALLPDKRDRKYSILIPFEIIQIAYNILSQSQSIDLQNLLQNQMNIIFFPITIGVDLDQ